MIQRKLCTLFSSLSIFNWIDLSQLNSDQSTLFLLLSRDLPDLFFSLCCSFEPCTYQCARLQRHRTFWSFLVLTLYWLYNKAKCMRTLLIEYHAVKSIILLSLCQTSVWKCCCLKIRAKWGVSDRSQHLILWAAWFRGFVNSSISRGV